jgi:hypothetical protein
MIKPAGRRTVVPPKTPDMCSYNPVLTGDIKVFKMRESKIPKYYDYEIRKSRDIPPVGTYNISGQQLTL